MLKTSFFLLCLLFSPVLMAQTVAWDSTVLELFDKPKKVKWMQHYRGRIDDLNDIAVTLAFDGKQCKGTLLYLRSKTSFTLEGQIKKGVLKLKEIDKKGQVSGHIKGKVIEGEIIGEWSNHNNSFGGSLFLEKTDKSIDVPSYCGNNKWIHHYTGEFQDKASDLILQKESDNYLKGNLYLAATGKSYALNGFLEENGLFSLKITDDYRNKKGVMTGSLVEAHALNASFNTTSGYQGLATYTLHSELLVGCVEFADYLSSYDITYPKLQHRQFNNWIDAVSNNWISNCRNYADEVRKKNKTETPALRASLRAYAWTDLDLLSDQLISGFITFSNTWSSGRVGQSFSFDLKKGKEITFDNLFKPEFDYRRYIWNELNRKIKKHPMYKNEGFRSWISALEFPYFTIRKEGVSFSSGFDTIYGQQRITIPFKDLKPYLRKGNPVEHLYINEQQ